MLTKIKDWVLNNKLATLLLVVVAYFIKGTFFNTLGGSNTMYSVSDSYAPEMGVSSGVGKVASIRPTPGNYAVSTDPSNRMVQTQSYVSVLVKNVQSTIKTVTQELSKHQGFVVNKYVNTPEGVESGNLVIRVPSEKLEVFLEFLRTNSVRVVSENISSNDVTDQYQDVSARLATLQKTKTVFEAMMDKATNVDEILRVQQAILNTQDQIDALTGQIKYLEATTATTLITINLSTDEYELPYAPSQPWRPEAIYKQAVRALITDMRSIGSGAIWIMVYSVIWVPALVVAWVLKRKFIDKR